VVGVTGGLQDYTPCGLRHAPTTTYFPEIQEYRMESRKGNGMEHLLMGFVMHLCSIATV
jgi:hypothetical protein